MKIHCLQHVSFEEPANIENWALERGYDFRITKFFLTPTPTLSLEQKEQPDLLVILGGPMNVNEDSSCPWLQAEKQYILSTIQNHKRVLGICLGAQLIANVLGAQVKPNPEPEIGWFPIEWHKENSKKFSFLQQIPSGFVPFHWHFDTYELPKEALSIAYNTACENQAFVLEQGRVVGFQFHPEMTKKSIETMLLHCSSHLTDTRPYIQKPETMRSQEKKLQTSKTFLYSFLDQFCC